MQTVAEGHVEETIEQSDSQAVCADEPIADAPDQWVEQYGDLLFRVALTRVADRSIAEDLVQEAFLAAWKARASFDGRSQRSTWLVSILKRKVADHFRKAGRQPESAGSFGDDVEEALFDERGVWREPVGKVSLQLDSQLEQQEFWQVMEVCVGQLPPTLGQAFSLRELESASPTQASSRLGITRKNLAVRIHRARLLLRRCLENRWLGQREQQG